MNHHVDRLEDVVRVGRLMLSLLIGTAAIIQPDPQIPQCAVNGPEKDAAAVVARLAGEVLPPAVIVLDRGPVDSAAGVVIEFDDHDALFEHRTGGGGEPLVYGGMAWAGESELV